MAAHTCPKCGHEFTETAAKRLQATAARPEPTNTKPLTRSQREYRDRTMERINRVWGSMP